MYILKTGSLQTVTTTVSTTTLVETTTEFPQFENNTIVVVYQGYYNFLPVLLNISGNVNNSIQLDEFEFAEVDTGSYLSCSFTQRGHMYIVGGSENRPRLSRDPDIFRPK